MRAGARARRCAVDKTMDNPVLAMIEADSRATAEAPRRIRRTIARRGDARAAWVGEGKPVEQKA